MGIRSKGAMTLLGKLVLTLVAMLLMLSPLPASGKGGDAVWIANNVDVLLFVRSEWVIPIRDAFAELEDVGPNRMPKFNVRDMGRETCKPSPKDYGRPVWVICTTSLSFGTGQTHARPDRHVIDRYGVKTWFDNYALDAMLNAPEDGFWLDDFLNLIRHEIMHGVIWIGDCYDCRPTTSAVHGSLTHFGSWDIQQLRKVYKKHDDPRDRGGKNGRR